MDADDIYPLTREAVRNLLETRRRADALPGDLGKRLLPRWPFPGTVQLWLPNSDGSEEHLLATLHDLSERGVGMRCDQKLELGQTLAIAIHQPEASFHGRATVRHCTPRRSGYHIGMEFNFA
jgi:hypothetical protein